MRLEELANRSGDEVRDAVRAVKPPAIHELQTKKQRRGLTLGVAGVALMVLLAGLLFWDDNTTITPPINTVEDSQPLFGERTGVVLIFDDGIDGVLAVAPDSRTAARSVLPGQRAGDQPYRLIRVHNSFVVGWGSVFSVDMASRQSKSMGDATLFIPSVQPAQVWMVDYPGPRIGGTPTVWKSNLDGDPVSEPKPINEDGHPAIGYLGGIALETDDGVAMWDASTGSVTNRLGTGSGWVSDSLGPRLSWCSGDCTVMQITNVNTNETVSSSVPDQTAEFAGSGFTERNARFSPDGSKLAATTGEQLVVIDTLTGESTVVANLPTANDQYYLGWSPDSTQLFASSYSYQEPTTFLIRYSTVDRDVDTAELPFGGALSFVVVDESEAQTYLSAQNQDPSDCPQVNTQPSGRTGTCGFDF